MDSVHLDDLAFLERQLLISSIGVGRHWHGVVIKESHKHTGQLLWLRFVVVVQGAASPPLPAPAVAIWKRGGVCCYCGPSTAMLATDARREESSPLSHMHRKPSLVREQSTECVGFWHLNGETPIPDSETEGIFTQKHVCGEEGGGTRTYSSTQRCGPPRSKHLFSSTIHHVEDELISKRQKCKNNTFVLYFKLNLEVSPPLDFYWCFHDNPSAGTSDGHLKDCVVCLGSLSILFSSTRPFFFFFEFGGL